MSQGERIILKDDKGKQYELIRVLDLDTEKIINDLSALVVKKDKEIDLMTTWINEHEDPFEDCHENNVSCADIECKDCIRKYFEERCK